MKILQKHLTKEILTLFALAFIVLTGLMLTGNLLNELADRFMSGGLSVWDIGTMVLYLLPTLATYTIPAALLFATLIAFIRSSQDCEIIAMKAAGIPIRNIFAPAVLIGLCATVFLLVLWAEIAPKGRRGLKLFLLETVMSKPTLVLNEQAWTHEVDNMRIFVGDIDNEEMLLKDVNIIIKDEDGPHRTIVASAGRVFVSDDKEKVFLELNKGSIHEYDPANPEEYSTTAFSRLTLPVNIHSINHYMRSAKKYSTLGYYRKKEMSLRRIVREALDPATGPDERRSLLRQIGQRTSMAFMALTFVLVGAPLGIIPYKTRRFYGVAVCGGLMLAYYSLYVLGEAISKKDLMNPVIALWIPNILLGLAGVVFIVRAERQ